VTSSARQLPPETTARPLGGSDIGCLCGVLLVALLSRLIPAYFVGVEVADLCSYRRMAMTVARNQDIYDVRVLFPYTPLSLYLPVLGLYLSVALHSPLHLVMKLFPIASDMGTAWLTFLLARTRWSRFGATVAALGYALNPVSVLISGFHGNIMPVSVFFAFWAYYLFDRAPRSKTFILSALALGIGIGLRSWPVLLLPFFLRPGFLTWRQRILYAALAAFPSVATLAPYLWVNSEGIIREAFGYVSTPDFGWVGIWRGIWFLQTGQGTLPWAATWLSKSRFLFLGTYGVLVAGAFLWSHVTDTAGWIVAALLLDYTLVGGVAAQYFGWVVPFLVFRPRFNAAFALVAGGCLVTFYLTWFPELLFGRYSNPLTYSRETAVQLNVAFLAATWALGALWLLVFLGSAVRRAPLSRQEPPKREPSTAPTANGTRLVPVGIVVLVGLVLVVVGLEIPYLQRTKAAPELPATVTWTTGSRGGQQGQVDEPIGFAVARDGDIYEADLGNARVQRFAADGTFLAEWKDAQLRQPTDVAVDSHDRVYVLDNAGAIYELGPNRALTLTIALVPLGSYAPRGLAFDDARDRIYVMDTGKGRVLVLDRTGNVLATWGGEGAPSAFDLGWGIGVDPQGNVIVAERGNSRVQKFSPDGVVLAEWMVKGDVCDLAVGPDGRVYITSGDRAKVWVYDSDGNALGQIAKAFVNQPATRGIGIAHSGDVIVGTEASIIRLAISFPTAGGTGAASR
jgi:sugar lactone lactonase YvrE